jgi:ferredoxin
MSQADLDLASTSALIRQGCDLGASQAPAAEAHALRAASDQEVSRRVNRLGPTMRTTERHSQTISLFATQVCADTEPGTPLLTVLRNHLGLKAAKFGCGQSLCGACTVWVDGRPTYSCDFPVEAVGSSEVRTLESLGTESEPHPLQQAIG